LQKNKLLKITAIVIFLFLIFASAVQAVVNIRDYNVIRFLGSSSRGFSSWEDFFNDASKIDPNPPGAGATDNYIIESGEVKIKDTYSVWTDPLWTRMKPIQINNNAGSSITNCILQINVSYDSDMQSDYDDLRFKHESLPSTWLDYFIETYNPTQAVVWVEIPFLQTGTSYMYLFYGNSAATGESNFDNVFSWENNWGADYKITNHQNNEGTWDPDVAFGSGRFFVAWEEGTYVFIQQEIRGTMFDTNGNVVVSEFEVFSDNQPIYQFRNEDPSMDFGGNKFFVAWEHYAVNHPLDASTMDIKGRTVTTTGGTGSVIDICSANNCQADPNVQFDSVNNRFCVVWEDARNGLTNYNIYGRLYDTNGNPVGSEKTISSAANSQCEPWVAYDPIHQNYMIVWEDGETPDNGPFDVYAGLFDKDLNSLNTPVKLADGDIDTDYNFPCVEFCANTQSFLVTWNDGDISDDDWRGNVWSAVLDTSGNVVVSGFIITSGNYVRTDIVPYFDTLFFVTYDGSNKIFGKVVSSNGSIVSSELQVSASGGAEADWANAAVGAQKIFVSWEDERVPDYSRPDVYGNIWRPNYLTSSGVTFVIGSEKEIVLDAHITSIKIQPANLITWDKFVEVSTRGDIVFDVLNGVTGALIVHDISSGYNLSGLSDTSIRLMASFTRSNPSTTPALDMWGVDYYTNDPPYAPSAPNPINGATNVPIDIDLSWTGGDPNGDPVTYDVYFGTSSSPPKVVGNQSSTIYDPGTLNFGTMYYWRIVAWDSFGASTTGDLWSFTTKVNNPPNTPTNPSPPNGAINVNLNVNLSWSGGDPDGDPVTYDVYLGTTSPPTLVISNQSGTTYNPGTLNYNTTYYWKIVAWDVYGATKVGPIWSFTTRTNHPPNTPINPSPSNGAVNVNVNADLSWTGGDPDPGDTVTYDVYFGTTSPPPIIVYGYTTTTYDPGTMNQNTTYYWKIVAWDSFGESTTGAIWSFTTHANSPPNTPSAPNPSNGATNVPIDTSLTWTCSDPDGDPVTYNVFFGTTSPPPKISDNQTTTIYDPPGDLDFSTTYFWQIVAYDNQGAFTIGPLWSFTTKANSPPNTPDNPNPVNHATEVSVNIILTWACSDPDGDELTYNVFLGKTSPPQKVSDNQTGASYDPPGALDFSTTYFWQIVAYDEYGASTSGPIWDFTTKSNSPPNIWGRTPANESTGVGVGDGISWQGSDPDGDPVTYDVYFGISSPPPLVVSNQSQTSFDPGTMNFNTTYYWKLIAWDDKGASKEEPIWWFVTKEEINTPPNAPTIYCDGVILNLFIFIKSNVEYEFDFVASDSNQDEIYYHVDWGDGTGTDWLGPFPTSEHIFITHTWPTNMKFGTIKAKVKDVHDSESAETTLYYLTIKSRNSAENNIIQRILQRFQLNNGPLRNFFLLLLKVIKFDNKLLNI